LCGEVSKTCEGYRILGRCFSYEIRGIVEEIRSKRGGVLFSVDTYELCPSIVSKCLVGAGYEVGLKCFVTDTEALIVILMFVVILVLDSSCIDGEL